MDAATKRIAAQTLQKSNLTFQGLYIGCNNCGEPLMDDYEYDTNQIRDPKFFENLVNALDNDIHAVVDRVADGSVKFFCCDDCLEEYQAT